MGTGARWLLLILSMEVASPASATMATDGLEQFDYNDLTLLKVIPGKGRMAAACFRASDGRIVWVHPKEAVGNRFGFLDKVLTDRVGISQVQPVNGTDWVPVYFYWPVATGDDARKQVAGCGNRPNR